MNLGIYIEGSHGIRLENELLISKGTKNSFGQFMYFEPITFIPFDLDAINTDMLDEVEKDWLNNYHLEVFRKTTAYLSEEESQWLKKYVKQI